MPLKSSLRLTLYKTEKTQWRNAAKKRKLPLSQLVRLVMSEKFHIRMDGAKKSDSKKEQMSIYDGGCFEHLPVMGSDIQL